MILSKTAPRDLTIHVELVPEGKDIAINAGFVQGDFGVIKAGNNRIEFSSLKLNQMRPIKAGIKNCKQPQPISFQMRFIIESQMITSSAFTLSSNISQFTSAEEKAARPNKKVKPNNETLVDTSGITFSRFIHIPINQSTSVTTTTDLNVSAVTTSTTSTVCTSQGGE